MTNRKLPTAKHVRQHEYGEHCRIPIREPPPDYQQRLQSVPWARASTAVFYQGAMMGRLYQITEDDLAELEHILPQLQDDLFPQLAEPLLAPRLRKQLNRIKEILSNVRWNYGPPLEVEIVGQGDDSGPE